MAMTSWNDSSIMACLAVLSLLFTAISAADLATRAESQCSCGYRDPSTSALFTDSVIAYFNETNELSSEVFHVADYANRNQRGWSTIFRQGASPQNVVFGNESLVWQQKTQSLELYLDGLRFDHLSNGATVRTMRQDILYGTFRAGMRSAQPWVGGSAMSMYLRYNGSQSLEFDLLNMNDANQARIMQLVNGEYPSDPLGLNYSTIQNGSPGAQPQDPWDFLDLKFDWSMETVSFWIGENRTRVATKDERTLPDFPQPLYFSHWSDGDSGYMQGPPVDRSVANVLYVRAFFNSSLMSDNDHAIYDARCNATLPCSVDDISLRGSTAYNAAALLPWVQPVVHSHIKAVAGYVAAAFSVFGVAALLNAFIRRTPWHKIKFTWTSNKGKTDRQLRRSIRQSMHQQQPDEPARSDFDSPAPGYTSSGAMTPLPGYESRAHSPWDSPAGPSRAGSIVHVVRTKISKLESDAIDVSERDGEEDEGRHAARDAALRNLNGQDDSINIVDEKKGFAVEKSAETHTVELPTEPTAAEMMHDKAVPDAMTGGATINPSTQQKPAEKQQRIDYLAGLVAISCIMVTLRHFSLTFWPYVTEGSGPIKHFEADEWLSYILGPYLLTPLWIGPFFVTSCRFLAQRYLRTGRLDDVANKMLLRAPRMLIPCFIFITLEYFLISLGLTRWLEWLPSVGYSLWPYVTPQSNFGVFLNNIVELSYIIPNAAPEIINHYCVGVLWTIPVQLQFSFVTLMAAVLIKDVKRPWKRFAFYGITILAGWYASSWSACHWLGLMLADMDLTYNWIKWTQARWWALYPILFLATAIVILSPLPLLFNSAIFDWSFMAYENGIHPNPITGRPIMDLVPIIWDAYPAYYTPSLIILTFSGAFQVIVELSTWVQAALSVPAITFLHPHIMTIYLTHGFVFWSLGSFIAVSLSNTNIPYWGTLLIIAVCCYTVILIIAVLVTPLTDFATKGSTKNIWRWATEEPVPHRPTTAPFGKALVMGRMTEEGTPSA